MRAETLALIALLFGLGALGLWALSGRERCGPGVRPQGGELAGSDAAWMPARPEGIEAPGLPSISRPESGRRVPAAILEAAEPPSPEPLGQLPGASVLRIERPGRSALLARALGWDPESLQARLLEEWLGRMEAARERLALAAGSTPAEREQWNREAGRLALELAAYLGPEAADRIARQVPLHRIDTRTGEIRRTDLDGRPIVPGDGAADQSE